LQLEAAADAATREARLAAKLGARASNSSVHKIEEHATERPALERLPEKQGVRAVDPGARGRVEHKTEHATKRPALERALERLAGESPRPASQPVNN